MSRIFEDISDGAAICDSEGQLTFANAQMAQITERPPEELLGQPLWQVYPQTLGSTVRQELQKVFTEGVTAHFQAFHPSLNRWLAVRAYPLPTGVLILHQDITEWKQSELALQQNCESFSSQLAEQTAQLQQTQAELERQTHQRQQAEAALRVTNEAFARLLESITDGFCAVDPDWRFTYINRRAEQLLHKYASELLGRNLWDVYPEFVGSVFYRRCREAMKTGNSIQLEIRCSSLSRWFQITLYPSKNGISFFFQDITARKQVEQERDELLQQEQKARTQAELAHNRCTFLSHASTILASSLNYETTLSNVVQLAVPLLADFCLVHRLEADGTLRQITAWHGNEQKQTLVNELGELYAIPSQNSDSLIAQVLQTGEPVMVTDASAIEPLTQNPRIVEIHRQLAPQSLIVVPLTAREQKFGTMMLAMGESNREYDALDLAVAADLGRRAAIAIDNAYLHEKAQEANRLKDEFLMTLSHELRSPLNAILGWAQMLRHRQLSHRTSEQALEVIEKKAKALTQIVYDLLTLSQVVTGQLRLRPGLVKLDTLIQEVVESLHLATTAKGIRLVTNLDAAIKPIQADARYLRQVVWNLLSNAIKFTPAGGCINVQLLRLEQSVQIVVRDTGEGIATPVLPYIFDHFRQADSSSTRSHEGLGVGLSLVRNLVELHGGTVQVLSAGRGQGTTFIVELPFVCLDTATYAGIELSSDRQPTLETQARLLENLRILVVDAQLYSRNPLLTQLERDGAEVLAVASTTDAIEILESFDPNLLLVTIHKLGIEETKLLAMAKAYTVAGQGKGLPAIALTQHRSEQERTQALTMGFQVYLSQQIYPDEISTIVAATARQNRSV